MPKLTKDQLFILQAIIDGKLYKQIAQELRTNEGHIRILVHRAKRRAGLVSTYQLIALVVGLGLCTPPAIPVQVVSTPPKSQVMINA